MNPLEKHLVVWACALLALLSAVPSARAVEADCDVDASPACVTCDPPRPCPCDKPGSSCCPSAGECIVSVRLGARVLHLANVCVEASLSSDGSTVDPHVAAGPYRCEAFL